MDRGGRGVLKKFFDSGNPLMVALAIAADLILLNIAALICCLPVVTAGAALSALSGVSLQLVRGEETYVMKNYFHSLRVNLKQGIPLGLIFLLAAVLIFVDYRFALAVAPVLRYPVAAVGILVLALAIYAFALQGHFENTIGGTLKNAARLLAGYLPRTAGMLAFTLVMWLLAIRYFQYGLPVLLMFGFSLPCYVSALLYDKIFKSLEENETQDP